MASPELEIVIEMMREFPPIQGETIPEMRASMEKAAALQPRPDDVDYEAVDAGGVPAEWTRTPGGQDGRVLVYFHGGGYAIGSIDTHRQQVTRISRAAQARVLSVGYRLAPEHPYPAAVEDAVAAYRWVLGQGIAPSRVALAGDSAGGGLTVATLLALREAGDPLPAAGVCISPWLDLTHGAESIDRVGERDVILKKKFLPMFADAYVADASVKEHTLSPLFADLRGLPPLLIQAGTADLLVDDSTRFGAKAQMAGVDVTVDIWEDMLHVWHAFADMLPEAREAIDQLGAFLQARWN